MSVCLRGSLLAADGTTNTVQYQKEDVKSEGKKWAPQWTHLPVKPGLQFGKGEQSHLSNKKQKYEHYPQQTHPDLKGPDFACASQKTSMRDTPWMSLQNLLDASYKVC